MFSPKAMMRRSNASSIGLFVYKYLNLELDLEPGNLDTDGSLDHRMDEFWI